MRVASRAMLRYAVCHPSGNFVAISFTRRTKRVGRVCRRLMVLVISVFWIACSRLRLKVLYVFPFLSRVVACCTF